MSAIDQKIPEGPGTPLVSVVVSAYNRPEMLKTALDSVLNQTLSDIEIIVQDDSSNDECEQVVNGIKDRRIRYTHNRPSLGTAANLRAGYRSCQGKYISTLNDDDFYAPEYLETMASILEANPGLSIAFCDHFIVDSSGNVLLDVTDRSSEDWERSTMKEGIVPNTIRTALVKKSVPGMFAMFRSQSLDLSDFPEEVSSGYDYWMTYLAVRNGEPIYYHAARLTYYRIHSGNQSFLSADPTIRLGSVAYLAYMYRRFLEDERVASVWPEIRKMLAAARATLGLAHLRVGNRQKALSQFSESIKTAMNRRAVAGVVLIFLPLIAFRILDRPKFRQGRTHQR